MGWRRTYLIMILVALLIVSCGTPARPLISPTSEGDLARTATVTIWTSWSGEAYDHLMQAFRAYQDTHPSISIIVEVIDPDDLLDRYRTAAAKGEGPTILIGPSSWGVALYREGFAADLAPILNPLDLTDFQTTALESVTYENIFTGVPLQMTGVVTYRNTKLLPEYPGSLERLEALKNQFAVHDGVTLYADVSFYFSGASLISTGGSLMDSQGQPSFTKDSSGTDWLGVLERFADAGRIAFDDDTDGKSFIDGQAAIIFDRSSSWQRYADALGTESLMVDPWMSVDGKPLSGFVSTENAYLSTHSSQEERENAAGLLKFLVSSDGQAILARAGLVPVRLDVPVEEPLVEQMMYAFQGGTALPILPEMEDYYTPMNLAIQSYLYEGNDALEALQEATRLLNTADD